MLIRAGSVKAILPFVLLNFIYTLGLLEIEASSFCISNIRNRDLDRD